MNELAVEPGCSKEETKRSHGTKEKIEILVSKLPILGDMFIMHDKIGEGTFSNVYLASLKPDVSLGEEGYRHFAIKHLIPTCSPSRVVKELKCMQDIGGVDNVVGISMCLRNNDCITFIMPYQRHDRFSSYVSDMQVEETQLYMRELLIALRRVHQFKIIHRDIKPSNFLYCRENKKFLLVDFGLAQQVDELKVENYENMKDKKRKRSDEEEDCLTSIERIKRQALQSLDANVPLPAKPSTPIVKKADLYNLKKNVGFSYRSVLGERANVALIHPGLKKAQTATEKIFAKPQAPLSTQCNCDGKAQVCHCCLVRKGMNTPRAGTPGFRPPEVLLKSPFQDTAVDIWAVGVIFLCILSRTYPFFRSPDDVTALAELITVFGSEEIRAVAQKLGRNVICSEVKKPVNLEKVCKLLSRRKCGSNEAIFPPEAYDLLRRLLDLDPSTRISAEEALQHPFITSYKD
uniref:non-specific serine/threonine protein kinase n=1 Tax=Lygus hesperus TaxID=30085 RepID=A0A0A9YHR4_LYGHE